MVWICVARLRSVTSQTKPFDVEFCTPRPIDVIKVLRAAWIDTAYHRNGAVRSIVFGVGFFSFRVHAVATKFRVIRLYTLCLWYCVLG